MKLTFIILSLFLVLLGARATAGLVEPEERMTIDPKLIR